MKVGVALVSTVRLWPAKKIRFGVMLDVAQSAIHVVKALAFSVNFF